MNIVSHSTIQEFELMGNLLSGLATPSRGARKLEVWQFTIAPDAATPVHRHSDEEIVVVFKGSGAAHADGQAHSFESPCTLILPGDQLHQLVNTGADRMEGIAVVPIGSKVFDADGNEMVLPWRE